MKQCQRDDSAWRLLNSVFCIEPTGIHSSTRQFKFKDGAWSNYSSTSTTTTTSATSDTITTSSTTSCPAGYDYKEGDIPGWGQLKGRIKTTMEGCSDECSNQAGCCSYEYSYSSGVCNLNKDCEPTVGKYKDYLFCTKGMENLTPLHSVPAEVTTTTLQSPTTSIEGCPAGYAYKEGDIPGWGQLKGRIETTMEGCSDECSNQAGCCSYEYS